MLSRGGSRQGINSFRSAFYYFRFKINFIIYKGVYFGGLYDPLSSGGGDVRVVKESLVSLNSYSVAKYLVRAPFGNEGWIININNLEDLLGGHLWVGVILLVGGIFHVNSIPFQVFIRSFTWSGEAYLSYSLSAISIMKFTIAVFSWYNNSVYPSEFFGPTGPEASQAQGFIFCLGTKN